MLEEYRKSLQVKSLNHAHNVLFWFYIVLPYVYTILIKGRASKPSIVSFEFMRGQILLSSFSSFLINVP